MNVRSQAKAFEFPRPNRVIEEKAVNATADASRAAGRIADALIAYREDGNLGRLKDETAAAREILADAIWWVGDLIGDNATWTAVGDVGGEDETEGEGDDDSAVGRLRRLAGEARDFAKESLAEIDGAVKAARDDVPTDPIRLHSAAGGFDEAAKKARLMASALAEVLAERAECDVGEEGGTENFVSVGGETK